jgi:ATP-dependent Zn protease
MIPPNYPYTFDALRMHGVIMEIEAANDPPLITALISWAPILFLIGLWMLFMRSLRRGQKPAEPKQ